MIAELSRVIVGKPFTISAEVTNIGYREGSFQIQLSIDGSRKTIALLDGETDNVSFKTILNEISRHTIEVNGFSRIIKVVKASPSIEKEMADRFKELFPIAYDFVPVI